MAEEKYGVRLQSGNFRTVTSDAVETIDYSPEAKIIEIEFKNEDVYHYLDAKKTEWNKMLEFADKKKGLGGYVNQVFKVPYKKGKREYYKLNIIEEKPHFT
jgi:hypothetical protein